MTECVIYSDIPRCDPTLIDEFAPYSVADLLEAMGALDGRIRLMGPGMRGIQQGRKIVGQAVTSFNHPGDNVMIHAALNVATAGDVLVLVNGGNPQGSLWGDVAATFARRKGIAGVVADGPVRDTAALREMDFRVWSTIVSPSHPEKRGPGAVNIPVVCGGVLVEPGNIIVADDDGVLAIPLEQARDTLEKARQRFEKEASLRTQIAGGASLFELLNMQSLLNAAGARLVEGTWRTGPRPSSRAPAAPTPPHPCGSPPASSPP